MKALCTGILTGFALSLTAGYAGAAAWPEGEVKVIVY